LFTPSITLSGWTCQQNQGDCLVFRVNGIYFGGFHVCAHSTTPAHPPNTEQDLSILTMNQYIRFAFCLTIAYIGRRHFPGFGFSDRLNIGERLYLCGVFIGAHNLHGHKQYNHMLYYMYGFLCIFHLEIKKLLLLTNDSWEIRKTDLW